MPTDFTLPELGENITGGDVVRVLVSPGDTISNEQPVLELETDKATIEVPSTVSGKVTAVNIKQGDRVKVGQVVLTVDAAAASASPEEKAPPKAAKGKESPARDEPPAQQEEEPAPAEIAPKPRRGEVVEISRAARSAPAPQPMPQVEQQPAGPAAAAAPSVRRLARELGVDVRRVTGTGPEGRIRLDDVHTFVRGALAGGVTAAPDVPMPDFSRWGEVERKPMSNIRRKTAEHLSHAWTVIPHVTQHDKADITQLEALRKQYGPQAEKAGGKLTMTAIALKIAEGALRRFPQFNSSIDVARNEMIFRKSIHIGVAVDTERGLLVPVIRDVDRKGLTTLAVELTKASDKARAGKLMPDEMQGGGFTITNLGGIGGTSFTPVVNWPEVAILGISRGAQEPRWNGQQFEPRLMLPLSLSYDHRAIDGADAARFLRWVAEAFEEPFVMAL
jgi:pyruvate dehydrogenase E2 component (dihydrolipoamide acetyltransferase)